MILNFLLLKNKSNIVKIIIFSRRVNDFLRTIKRNLPVIVLLFSVCQTAKCHTFGVKDTAFICVLLLLLY